MSMICSAEVTSVVLLVTVYLNVICTLDGLLERLKRKVRITVLKAGTTCGCVPT